MAHILLYGGTFDPIHHGHLIPCLKARELLGADQVLLIPAGISPHKLADVASAPAEHRLAMVQLAIAHTPHFAVDGRELQRTRIAGGKPSYTYDTIMELKAERPQDRFTWLLGADQLPKLHTWHRIRELMAAVDFAVLPRPALSSSSPAPTSTPAPQLVLPRTVSTPLIDIAATDIRHRVANGLAIDFLAPPAVVAYIRANKLYQRI